MTETWHKSSYSTSGSHCVEVSEGTETLVRDTRNRPLGHLSAPTPEWAALLAAVRYQ
ncbi:DUF397 domain-containing protein [Nocardiopsis tropica]|uniref:DUF397 domain-containing protein n=1 Tax=Nocardiopsis tropica TaxID=109330 RepID=A0ABU7KPW3_9ACTN|nr:DUF397 domain-containing protein [Nocardiopsis umidischolae]MEE2051346.1 DUF397 domain-containing protein [Nocardiopsis umidischolae]